MIQIIFVTTNTTDIKHFVALFKFRNVRNFLKYMNLAKIGGGGGGILPKVLGN